MSRSKCSSVTCRMRPILPRRELDEEASSAGRVRGLATRATIVRSWSSPGANWPSSRPMSPQYARSRREVGTRVADELPAPSAR